MLLDESLMFGFEQRMRTLSSVVSLLKCETWSSFGYCISVLLRWSLIILWISQMLNLSWKWPYYQCLKRHSVGSGVGGRPFKNNQHLSKSGEKWMLWKHTEIKAVPSSFPVKRKLQLMFCMVRNSLVLWISNYMFKVFSRPEFKVKVRMNEENRIFIFLVTVAVIYPVLFMSCVCACAFMHLLPNLISCYCRVQRLILGKGSCLVFTPAWSLRSSPWTSGIYVASTCALPWNSQIFWHVHRLRAHSRNMC